MIPAMLRWCYAIKNQQNTLTIKVWPSGIFQASSLTDIPDKN